MMKATKTCEDEAVSRYLAQISLMVSDGYNVRPMHVYAENGEASRGSQRISSADDEKPTIR